MTRRPVAIASLAFLAACKVNMSHSTPPSKNGAAGDQAEATAVRAARTAQNAAIATHDTSGIAKYWTEDVEIRRALGILVTGKPNYLALFVNDTSSARTGTDLIYQREPDRVDISAAWPLAYEEGRWFGHLHTLDGPTMISGRYAAQWVKREGRWLIRGEVYTALSCDSTGCDAKALP